MDTGEMPWPTQTADIRSRSMSKQAQHSLPRFRMFPRGVRLSAGKSRPNLRPYNTEEKNGKLVSTKSAQIGWFPTGFVEGSAARDAIVDTNKPMAKKHTGTWDRFRVERKQSIPSARSLVFLEERQPMRLAVPYDGPRTD